MVTPQGSEFNSGIALRVPYYLVPRALSDIKTKLGSKLKPSNPTTTANITNEDGVIAGDADFYAWGLSEARRPVRRQRRPGDRRAVVPVQRDEPVHRVLGEHV